MIAVKPFNKATNVKQNIGDTAYGSRPSPGRHNGPKEFAGSDGARPRGGAPRFTPVIFTSEKIND